MYTKTETCEHIFNIIPSSHGPIMSLEDCRYLNKLIGCEF